MSAAEIENILTRLSGEQVDFVVIGGVAALAHGSALFTFDVDLCYRRTPDNIERLCRALAPLKPRLRGGSADLPFTFDPVTVQAGLNFTLTTDLLDLDLLGEVSGLGEYEAVQAASEALTLYDFPVRVLTLEGLIAAKRAANRPKDREAIIELEALLELRKRPPD